MTKKKSVEFEKSLSLVRKRRVEFEESLSEVRKEECLSLVRILESNFV